MSLASALFSRRTQALYGIKDIKRGKGLPSAPDSRMGVSEVDYSHLLPKYYRKKLRLIVQVQPENMASDTLTALVQPRVITDKFGRHETHGSLRGVLRADESRKELQVEDAQLLMGLRGRGIGKAMYEALYREAHELGATHVRGGVHSTNAENVHQSLAAKHGWDYDARPNTVEEGGDWPLDDWIGDRSGGSRDDRWQDYEFELNGLRR